MIEEIDIEGGVIKILWDKHKPLPLMIVQKDGQEIEIDLTDIQKQLYAALNFLNVMMSHE